MTGNRPDPQLRDIAAELSILRRGVEGLFDQIDRMGASPDYRSDIGALAKGVSRLSEQLGEIQKAPGVVTSAEQYATFINASVEKATARSHERLNFLEENLSMQVDRLDRRLKRDLTANEQDKALILAFFGGLSLPIIFGLLMWLV